MNMNKGGIHPRLLATITTLSRVLVLAVLLWSVLILQALADPAQTAALEAGKQFGQAAVSGFTLPGVMAESLPGFVTDNPAEVQHQSAGMGLEDKARSVLFSASPDNASGQTLHSILNHPVFKLDRDDPLIKKTDKLIADVENAPDNATGMACKTLTVTDPAVDSTDQCMEHLKTVDSTCKRSLAVSCASSGACGADNRVLSVSVYASIGGAFGIPDISEYQVDGKRVIRLANGFQGWGWTWRWQVTDPSRLRSVKIYGTSHPSFATATFGSHSGYFSADDVQYWNVPVGTDVTHGILSAPYALTIGGGLGDSSPGHYVDFMIDEDCGCQSWTETWTDGCGAYASNPACELQTSGSCTDNSNPRMVAGTPVSRDCWEYTDTYRCYDQNGDKGEDDYCRELRDAGCTQTSSACVDYLYGRCIAWEQSYQCSVPGKTRTIEDCSGQLFCTDGDQCFDGSYAPNGDFSLAASYLSAAEEAGKDMDGGLNIFNGNHHKCKKTALGFKNCCKNSGWGLGFNLSQCSESEKILGEKRAAGMCHYLGSYKDGSLFANRYDSYCCFNSKLARIIHEQGRPYVPLDWGSAKRPVCRGFTPDELARVDFGKLDFSEFFADALVNADKAIKPGMHSLSGLIKDRILQQLPSKR